MTEVFCLYGGSFSPPHKAHAGSAILAALGLAGKYPGQPITIGFAPVPDTYAKESTSIKMAMNASGKNLSSFISEQERIEMLEIYCAILNRLFSEGGTAAYFDMPSVQIPAGLPVRFTVDMVSIALKTGIFIEMLQHLEREYPERKTAMLLGHDNMLALKSWRRMDLVAKMVDTFVVVKRGDVNPSVEDYAAMFPEGTDESISQKLLVVSAPPDYSSSKIRAMWAAGDEAGVAKVAGAELADYMRTQGIGMRTKNNVKAMFSRNQVIKSGGALKNRFMNLLARPFRGQRKTARKALRRTATRKQRATRK